MAAIPYPVLVRDKHNQPIPALRPLGATEAIAIGGTSTASAAGYNYHLLRILTQGDCLIEFGDDTVEAVATSMPLFAGMAEVVPIMPGQYVAVIQLGSGSGNVYITPVG